MPEFDYVSLERGTGRSAKGTIDAPNAALAVASLKSRGLLLTALTPSVAESGRRPPSADVKDGEQESAQGKPMPRPSAAKWEFRPIVRSKGVTVFTRQLALLVKAGLPLHRALEVLARSEQNPRFQGVISGLSESIRSGNSLSHGLRQWPRIFSDLYVAMAAAGEAGGMLDAVLDRLARFLERRDRIKGRVKAALTYPVIILLVAGGILSGLVIFVIPKFQLIFRGMLKGQTLPSLTQGVLSAAELFRHHFVLAALLALAAGAGWRVMGRTRLGRRWSDKLLIRSPVMGDLLLKASVARFARTFGSLLATGVPMLDALAITRSTSGNVHVEEALGTVQAAVNGGGMVAQSLEATALFPSLVSSMIEVGEQTGALPEVLARIADAYDEEVDLAVGTLTAMLEPIMIVVMALVVGVIVIALFLPIVSIVQHLQ